MLLLHSSLRGFKHEYAIKGESFKCAREYGERAEGFRTEGNHMYICWTVRWASVLAKNQINIVPDRKSENKLFMFF